MMSVEFEDNRVKVKSALKNASIVYLHEACGELQAQTRRNSRVRSGQTKGSYGRKVDEAALVAVIGSDYENAIWEEFGTGEYALHGDGRKGGWVYKDENGKRHFTCGKNPNKPMLRAFNALKGKLIKRAEEVLRTQMGG